MDPKVAIDLGADRLRAALHESLPPALLPLPRLQVSAETWEQDKHVRLHGEALYALHSGDRAHWAVIVRESNVLEPGQIRMIDVTEIRCESSSGRRAT